MIVLAIGSSLGAMLRYLFTLYSEKWFKGHWAIFTINVIGSFLFGLLITESTAWTSFLCTGILGGFTTFSTFIIDTYRLIEQKATIEASIYAICSICLSLIACIIGTFIGGV